MAEEQKGEIQEERTENVAGPRVEPRSITGRERTPSSVLAMAERTSPFSFVRQFMDEMDRLVSGFGFAGPSKLSPFRMLEGGGLWSPAIETFERDNRVVFRLDLPGMVRDDVRIEVLGDELIIKGERKQEKEESTGESKEEATRGGGRYSECRYGSFERRFTLPEGCDADSIEASLDNGVLEVSCAVSEPEKPTGRTIQIKGGAPPEGGGPGSIH